MDCVGGCKWLYVFFSNIYQNYHLFLYKCYYNGLFFFQIPNGIGCVFGLAQLILYGTYYKSTKKILAERQKHPNHNGEINLATDYVHYGEINLAIVLARWISKDRKILTNVLNDVWFGCFSCCSPFFYHQTF